MLKRWSALHRAKKVLVAGQAVPDRNQEYFLYQTLIGAWPLFDTQMAEFKERIKAYVIKAAREAKIHTWWTSPNPEHENALTAFVEAVLDDKENHEFLEDFNAVHDRLAWCGALNSLSQVFLKIVSPGVPDFYQGTELWELSLVDPDNRRPVEFQERARLLRVIKKTEAKNRDGLFGKLMETWKNGALKLFVVYKALNFRKSHLPLFLEGDYLPLRVKGPLEKHVIAFARHWEGAWAVVAAARFFTGLISEKVGFISERTGLFKEGAWQKTSLVLPAGAPQQLVNVFTAETVPCPQKNLPLAGIFRELPVTLLVGQTEGTTARTGKEKSSGR